jgi:hypothetical protein
MTANPTIEELQSSGDFELVKELPHQQIKEFVLEQINKRGKLIKSYVVYQAIMICLGVFFIGISVFQAFRGEKENLLYAAGSLVFGFSLLIVIHELLHGISFKIVGVPKVSYGGYLKKLIFYAEADQFVLNRKQFILIALFPLLIIQIISIFGVIVFFSHPAVYFFIVLMSLHSLFCAGDIALLSVFYQDSDEYFTYDSKSEKKSYYFRKKREG